MENTRKNTTKPTAKITSKKKKFTRVIFAMLFACVITFSGVAFLIYRSQELSEEKLSNTRDRIFFYDQNDNLVKDALDHQYAPIEMIPKHVKDAFIVTEDKRFYSHRGISPTRIARATVNNIKAGTAKEGASTISQQLIKNTHLTHDKTIKRKVREATLSIKMEREYSKEQILEMYLSAVYFGNGLYGIEAASRTYFGKSVSEIDLKQGACLAGMLRSPGRYCPVNNFASFNDRGNFVLSIMKDHGKITEEERASAREIVPVINPKTFKSTRIASSYKRAATIEAVRILGVHHADIANLGYQIYTYYCPNAQHAIFAVQNNSDYDVKNVSGNNADSVTIVANNSGNIKAFHASHPTLISARRNMASAIKPVAVYAPAIELGVVSPATHINDEPYAGGDFHPQNYDKQYRGMVSVRESVIHSHNIPAVKVLDYTGIERATRIGTRLGLSLAPDEALGMALGNTKRGNTWNEMIGAYATLANDGKYSEPSMIRKISDKRGNIVWQNNTIGTHAIGRDTAYIVTDMLRDTVTQGTAQKLRNIDRIAAKTGTAERGGEHTTNTDAICIAYTDDYVVLSWHGNRDMRPENDLPRGTGGGGITTFVVRDVFNRLPIPCPERDADEREFKIDISEIMPNTCVVRLEYDVAAAMQGRLELATDDTPRKNVKSDYFACRHAPTQKKNMRKVTAPKVDGNTADSGHPKLWFNTNSNQVYEIYRKNPKKSMADTLLEVIRGHSGEYTYYDKSARSGIWNEYYISASLANYAQSLPCTGQQSQSTPKHSDTIKILANENAKRTKSTEQKKQDSGKHWFF